MPKPYHTPKSERDDASGLECPECNERVYRPGVCALCREDLIIDEQGWSAELD